MKIYFLVWEFFRLKPKVQTIKVTESNFNKILNRNIKMLKYSEGESKERDKLEIFAYDLHNLKSKSLMASIFLRFDERPMLLKMDIQKKGSIMIGIKSFIECFEKI